MQIGEGLTSACIMRGGHFWQFDLIASLATETTDGEILSSFFPIASLATDGEVLVAFLSQTWPQK